MAFVYNPDTIRFLRDAGERVDTYGPLLERIRPLLRPDMTVCDAGCGLGYLSLLMAPYVKNVRAVDMDAAALAVLRENAAKRGIPNIEPVCGKLRECPPDQPYGFMVFCFYGHIDEILKTAPRQCVGKVAAFKRAYQNHRFTAGTHPIGGDRYMDAAARLQELGIPFQSERFFIPAGQPFRNLEDARSFFQLYTREPDTSYLTDGYLLSKLKITDDPVYPYFLDHERETGMLIFDTRDIPENYGE